MKARNNAVILLLIAGISFSSASLLQGQWLTHTYTSNNPPVGQSTTAYFPNGTGAYSGTVAVTASNFVDGTGDGYAGIVPTSFSGLTSTFNQNFPYNPGNTFDNLNIGSTDTGDTFDVTFDFSGLGGTNQYLPAFTTIALLDVDSLERIGSLTAYDPQGNIITGPWLQPLPPPRDLFDWAGGGIAAGHEATYTQAGGIYTFTGTATNDSSAFQGFATQFDIGSIQFHYDHNQAIFGEAPGGYGIAILAPVPEPATSTLLATAGIAGLVYLWRKLRKRHRCSTLAESIGIGATVSRGAAFPYLGALMSLSLLVFAPLAVHANTYQIDDGTSEFGAGNGMGGDFIALNEFSVTAGNNLISSISIAWGGPGDASLNGLTYTAVLWGDTDNNGVPTDSPMLVLGTIPNIVISGSGTNTFVTSTFGSPIFVPTQNFFVGFVVTNTPGQLPVASDTSMLLTNRSFYALNGAGAGDINDLNNNYSGLLQFGPTFMIRADAVPEPSTYALIIVGLVVGGVILLRQKEFSKSVA
jgi:hypothetical protein